MASVSTLGADIAWFRAEQAKLLTDRVRIRRPGGAPVFDEGTGTYTPGASSELYEGPGSIRWARRGGQARELVTGEEELRFEGYVLKLPPDTDVRKDDLVDILEVPHDAGLEGRTMRVVAVAHDSRQIARVCALEEVEAGA